MAGAGAGAGTGAGARNLTVKEKIIKKARENFESFIENNELNKFKILLQVTEGACRLQGTMDILIVKNYLLQLACINGKMEIFSHLVDSMGEEQKLAVINAYLAPDEPENKGPFPLYLAAQEGHNDIVLFLIGKGANVRQVTNRNMICILAAAERGQTDVVKTLLENGADFDDTGGPENETPLFGAAKNGHTDVVKVLLAEGADANKPSGINGFTPLYIAAQNGYIAIVQELFRHIETTRFSNPTAFEAFQRELMHVSELPDLSTEMQTLCKTEITKRIKEDIRWSPLRAAWIGAVVTATPRPADPDPTSSLAAPPRPATAFAGGRDYRGAGGPASAATENEAKDIDPFGLD